MLSFFPRGVLDEILNLIVSVSEGFPSDSLVRKKFILSKVYTEIKVIQPFIRLYTGDNPLAKPHGLSPRTGEQILV